MSEETKSSGASAVSSSKKVGLHPVRKLAVIKLELVYASFGIDKLIIMSV
jgi:hypothetical protein